MLVAVAAWQWRSSLSERTGEPGPRSGRLRGTVLAGVGFALVSLSDPGLLVAATSAQLGLGGWQAGGLLLGWIAIYQAPLLAVMVLMLNAPQRWAGRIDRLWSRLRRPLQRGLAMLLAGLAVVLAIELALALHASRMPIMGRLLG